MMHIMIVFPLVCLSITTVTSIDLKPMSMIEQPNHEDFSSRKLLATIESLNWPRSLTSDCPVCDGGSVSSENVDQGEDSDSGFRTIIKTIKTKLNTEGSILDQVRDGIVVATKNALGVDDTISVEVLIPILQEGANRFVSINESIQNAKSTEMVAGDTADLVMSIYDLKERIVVAIADLLLSIISLFASIKTSIVSAIADVILSILDLIEGIKLAIIGIIVDFLDSITGGRSATEEIVSEQSLSSISSILLSGGLGGIYTNVISMIRERDDDIGLIAILTDSANDMVVIDEKLNAFLYNANKISSDASSTDVTTSVSDETITQILDLIVETITAIVSLIVDIIVTVLNAIVGVIEAIINLIISIITGIIDLIISILNAILGIFSRQPTLASTGTVSRIGTAATILASPIYDLILCQLGSSSCTLATEEKECEMESITCQNGILKANVSA